jgi:hypothetical protein
MKLSVLALSLVALAAPAFGSTVVTSCDTVVGVGYNAAVSGTYLIPYPNGNTPWGFACSQATYREAKEPHHFGGGVVAHLCQTPIDVQYTYENFAVTRGYGIRHWMQACSRIQEVRVRPGGPGCRRPFYAMRCLSPRGLRIDFQKAGRLIPGYPTGNPGTNYGFVCTEVEQVLACEE